MWHVGILYRACDFLALIAKTPLGIDEITIHFPTTYHGVKTNELINVLYDGHWVSKDENGRISPSKDGQDLLQLPTSKAKLRAQVQRFLEILRPAWGALTAQGRQVFQDYAPLEVVQCFREAGVLDSLDDEAIVWWDRIAAQYRHEQEMQRVLIGRKGEKKSYHYELNRTGNTPYWIALQYEGAGYDIRSQLSDIDKSPLLIEVKTTSDIWERGKFYLSRHEWNVLSNSNHALIHLWSLTKRSEQLALVPVYELVEHIPKEKGSGQWDVMILPFCLFKSMTVSGS
jgi:hypothetical protein